MKNAINPELNKKISDWWENNPFTWGLSEKSGDLVGRIDLTKMDLNYFKEIDRKVRKHTRGGAQEDGAPLFSKLIDYDNSIKGKKVLDIAVGSGFSTVEFLQKGASEVVAVDITDFAVEQTKRNLACRGLQATVTKMDAQDLKFSDNYFDFVNGWGYLMHMPDTQKGINEIQRVLKPGGKMMAQMYNKSSWPFWFNTFFVKGILLGGLFACKFDIDRLTSRYSDGYSVGGNVLAKFYTPKQVADFFKKAGFSQVESFPLNLPDEPNHWPLRKFSIFKHLPQFMRSWMSKKWGYCLIVQAQK